jgi:hypothetical protein
MGREHDYSSWYEILRISPRRVRARARLFSSWRISTCKKSRWLAHVVNTGWKGDGRVEKMWKGSGRERDNEKHKKDIPVAPSREP